MFSWYRSQVRDYGVVTGTRMLWRAAWSLWPAKVANRVLPARFGCPCCGWEGRRFYDYVEAGYTVPNEACPRCDSHARHRALYLWLRDEFRITERRGRALVCAPERALSPLWESARGVRVWRTDILPERGVDVLADLQRLPFADESFDIIWCHHVLEQLEDDARAMGELLRVLRAAAGTLVVSVGEAPIPETREFGFADPSLSGNRRQYGADFPLRLGAAGFAVSPLDFKLSEAARLRYGLGEGVKAYVCEKRTGG